jgi:hypothetical protein
MNDFPDFSPHGYQVISELGRNVAGGRVVYLCQTLAQPVERVVIKQFQFAKGSSQRLKEIAAYRQRQKHLIKL